MSTSLYYSAVRTTPLTDDEKAEVDRLIAVHNDEFPFDYEVLDLYPSDIPDTLLNGSTKIWSDPTEVIPSLVYWFNALTELRRAVPDADWDVSLDDTPADWDDSSGYSLPGLDDMQ
ncbi:hypothetical protein ACQGAO_24955 [Rhodococcus sp. 1.20]